MAQEKLGKKNNDLVKAIAAFGGGLGAQGEVCGLIAGGLAAIGLLFGHTEENKDTDQRLWMYSREFMKRFQEEIAGGSFLCRDIARVDWTDPKQVQEYRLGEKRLKCKVLVGGAARLIGELIERAAT